jgi:hypothetical protein
LLQQVKDLKSLKSVARALIILAYLYNTCGLKIENGGCEGVRVHPALDMLVRGMLSLNLLPTSTSNPYHPDYELWMKEYGEEEVWKRVPVQDVMKVLRVAVQ